MLNQAAVEALYSASYVEDYLDCVENLPDDVQRNISQLREYDQKYQEILNELEQYKQALAKDVDAGNRRRIMLQIQRALIYSQELGDDKIEVLTQIQELIENKSRQLDIDYKNLGIAPPKKDFGRDHENHVDTNRGETQPERSSKRSRRQRNNESYLRDDLSDRGLEKETLISGGASITSGTGAGGSSSVSTPNATASGGGGGTNSTAATNSGKKKKKKRKTKADRGRESSPIEPPIDPNEPTYCLCEQVSYGEMIGCDNEECPIEWYHFSCVGLTTKPKGKWFCPKCRGDRSNQMKQKS